MPLAREVEGVRRQGGVAAMRTRGRLWVIGRRGRTGKRT